MTKKCLLEDLFRVITLFKAITVFYGTDNILQNINHIETKCEEYFVNLCQSDKTLLWL